MPIYEYECGSCGHVMGFLVLKPQEEKALRCRRCQGEKLRRVMSRFSVHQTESQRLEGFDTKIPKGEDFYRDNRNVGLWAKKRAQELGVDLGPAYEESVEKARSGKILDDF